MVVGEAEAGALVVLPFPVPLPGSVPFAPFGVSVSVPLCLFSVPFAAVDAEAGAEVVVPVPKGSAGSTGALEVVVAEAGAGPATARGSAGFAGAVAGELVVVTEAVPFPAEGAAAVAFAAVAFAAVALAAVSFAGVVFAAVASVADSAPNVSTGCSSWIGAPASSLPWWWWR